MRDYGMIDDSTDDLVAIDMTGGDLLSIFDDHDDGDISEPDDVRHQCDLRGRFYLDRWASSPGSPDRPLTCRIKRISPFSVTVAAPVRATKGEAVRLGIEEIGAVTGRVTRAIGALLTIEIDMAPWERTRLARKVAWMERRRTFSLAENRRGDRFVPGNTRSRIVLRTGITMPCDIVDLSGSGAAVNAETVPEIGTVLAIGKLVSRVVRHTESGFAVQFVRPVIRDEVEVSATVDPVGDLAFL